MNFRRKERWAGLPDLFAPSLIEVGGGVVDLVREGDGKPLFSSVSGIVVGAATTAAVLALAPFVGGAALTSVVLFAIGTAAGAYASSLASDAAKNNYDSVSRWMKGLLGNSSSVDAQTGGTSALPASSETSSINQKTASEDGASESQDPSIESATKKSDDSKEEGNLEDEYSDVITSYVTEIFSEVADIADGIASEITSDADEFISHFSEEIYKKYLEPNLELGEEASDFAKEFQKNLSDILSITQSYYDSITNSLADTLIDWEVEGIDQIVNTDFTRAFNSATVRDPLVLDLDGDGIETLAADGSVLFDHNSNGIRTATGWVKSDDGLLALDLNGNGTIDSGRELFGDNTLLRNGQTAANGFVALSELDHNKDGAINAADAVFSDLRVWRDLNADGISQKNELFTLKDVGIKAINTSGKQDRIDAGHGNIISATGSFVWEDKSKTTPGFAGNLDFRENNFHREFVEKLPIPEDMKDLPDLKGSGAVRDLREAATQSPALRSLLEEYSSAKTKAQQDSLLDSLLAEWAATSVLPSIAERIAALRYENGSKSVQFEFKYSWEQGSAAIEESSSQLRQYQLEMKRLIEKNAILEAFNGELLYDFVETKEGYRSDRVYVVMDVGSRDSRTVSLNYTEAKPAGTHVYVDENAFHLLPQAKRVFLQTYQKLRHSVYQGLVLQTRLKPFIDSIDLKFDGLSFSYDFSQLQKKLDKELAEDKVEGLIKFAEFNQLAGPHYLKHGWQIDSEKFKEVVSSLSQDEKNKLKQNGIIATTFDGYYKGFNNLEKIHFIVDGDNSSPLHGGDRADWIMGNGGNDSISGRAGHDIIDGGAGNDYLFGDEGNDHLIGGDGSDLIEGDAGDDILNGGKGYRDQLEGGAGSDTYLFAAGDGSALIRNFDPDAASRDVLRLLNVNADTVTAKRSGSSLSLKLEATGDWVHVAGYFAGQSYELDAVEFEDGTRWDPASVKAKVLKATDGADRITGYASDDVLRGQAGNDTVRGADGNDTIFGDAGHDRLYGDERCRYSQWRGGLGPAVRR